MPSRQEGQEGNKQPMFELFSTQANRAINKTGTLIAYNIPGHPGGLAFITIGK